MKKLKTNTQTKQRLVTLLILVLIMVILSCISNKYLTVNNLINIVRQESTLIIIACAATMLMISGGMDLSPAGVIALTSVVFAKLCVAGISIPLAALLSLLVGVAAGTFSGLLVVLANVPPMIATLGTWYITKGLAYAISNSYAIVQGLPANFGWVNRYIGPFPLMVVIAVAVFAVFYILLNRTLLGEYAYAIGGNSETARLSGIKVNLVRCVLYILTALMSSFVGILMSSRINSGDPNLSTSGIEFEIIVAIILGGTSLLGGQGSLIGTLIGALILGNLSNGMNLLGIGTVYQFIVEGAVLVVAVVLDLTLKGNGLRIKKLRRSN
jgi:D-ribose transport system permease protein